MQPNTPVVYHGNCLDVLRCLPANSIDSVVCDPPYHLTSVVKRFGSPDAAPAKFGTDGAFSRASAGFMGKAWDGGDIAFRPETWAEVGRVLKPGGHLAAFGASRGYHRMACAIEDAGFEIRDSLMWVYGTGFPKSHDVSKGIDRESGAERMVIGTNPNHRAVSGVKYEGVYAGGNTGSAVITAPATDAAREWQGWGTALKPAFEPIVLARKPLSEGTVAANVLRWGTGALNIDGCRVEAESRPLVVSNRRNGNNTYGDGLCGSVAVSSTTEGRWPANVVHDGSDEVVGAFPTTTSGARNGVRKPDDERNTFGAFNGGDSGRMFAANSGSAARFFYSAKASKADRAGSKHPTVKPVALMQWLCRLITPPGGLVLDPFAGSGTTGAAAIAEGFRAVLIEREDEYVADILRRFAA